MTLSENTVNSQYIYMIAVEDPNFEKNGTSFLKSGTKILITNGITNIERKMESVEKPSVEEEEVFYLFGCLLVNDDGSFAFKDAGRKHFFNGYTSPKWDYVATLCPGI